MSFGFLPGPFRGGRSGGRRTGVKTKHPTNTRAAGVAPRPSRAISRQFWRYSVNSARAMQRDRAECILAGTFVVVFLMFCWWLSPGKKLMPEEVAFFIVSGG